MRKHLHVSSSLLVALGIPDFFERAARAVGSWAVERARANGALVFRRGFARGCEKF
jgi:hypothetical protein